jgi:putative ABC transport system permease protein
LLINHFKIAFRYLLKYRFYSLINILGLAIGLACALLIFLWIHDELSFDDFHANRENIYRIIVELEEEYPKTCDGLAPALKENLPEIINAVRFRFWGGYAKTNSVISQKERKFNGFEKFADPAIFSVFTFPLTHGNPETALQNPNSVVISSRLVTLLFENENPIGQTVRCGQAECVVTGVVKKIPRNSHMQFDWIRPFSVIQPGSGSGWDNWEYWTYLQVEEGTDIAALEQKIFRTIRLHIPDWEHPIILQPLDKVYLHSNFQYDIGLHGEIRYVYIFAAVVLFILLIAIMNYVNLVTAYAGKRVKEVCVKKILGAKREQLSWQFIIESLLLSYVSLFLALFLVEIALPFFNNFTGKSLQLHLFDNFYMLPILTSLGLLLGILSGSYPAIILSLVKANSLAKTPSKSGSSPFRNTLVLLQFSIALIIMICTFIVAYQMKYLQNKDLGFTRENIVNFQISNDKYEIIKNDLISHPGIVSVGAADVPIYKADAAGTTIHDWPGRYDVPALSAWFLRVGYDFQQTFDMQMIQGRFFNRQFETDANEAVVLNEAAVKAMNLDEPVGKEALITDSWQGSEKMLKIIGVVKDFNFKSLHHPIEPMVLRVHDWHDWPPTISVRIKPDQLQTTMAFIEQKYKAVAPERTFEYHFVDDELSRFYTSERRIGQMFFGFSALAIFIACLGLVGLAAFVAEQRTKEIGLRKVLGASVPGIVTLLSNDFAKWVLLANLVAWPVAYFAMNKWLKNFAYRVEMSWPREIAITEFLKLLVQDPITGLYFFFSEIFISRGWWMFALAGGVALTVALLTVSWQAIRAATANPVEALRYE